MLKFVPDHLKTKIICKHAVKKLPFLTRYVSDWYKTQQMCDQENGENGGTLKSVPDCYKNQEMCLLFSSNRIYSLILCDSKNVW